MKNQTTAKLVTRLIGTALIVALVGRTVAASEIAETRSTVVKFTDLNLDSSQGVAVLYKRIHVAAEEVCGASSQDREFFEVAAAVKKCVGASEDRAIDFVHNDGLSAYYSKKTGRATPMFASNRTK